MSESGSRLVKIIMAVLLLIAMAIIGKELADAVKANRISALKEQSEAEEIQREKSEIAARYGDALDGLVIMLDPGHGGDDPGKVGVTGILEKDVNLTIAGILKDYMEQTGASVYMTRESDDGLYDEGSRNKKVQDLKRRIAMIEEKKPDFVISIHQNSYPDAKIKGAQCFYFTSGEAAGSLAETIQQELRTGLDPDNHREAKTNDNYYLLKKTPVPTVIVECGFLSNYEESELLADAKYQRRVAECILKGIIAYIEGGK